MTFQFIFLFDAMKFITKMKFQSSHNIYIFKFASLVFSNRIRFLFKKRQPLHIKNKLKKQHLDASVLLKVCKRMYKIFFIRNEEN